MDRTRGLPSEFKAQHVRPVLHLVLLGARILICEHMCNLHLLPPGGFTLTAVPVKVKGMGTFPVRAFATIRGQQ